jgi:hypothetical protein
MTADTTQTILNTVPTYVKGMFDLYGILSTKRMIYQMMKIKRHNEPYLFSDRDWGSTYGTLRSILSDFCRDKECARVKNMKGLLSFNLEGVDYFYNDEEQIKLLAIQNNGKIEITNTVLPKVREHCNIQFQLCGIFTKLGYKVWAPKQDTNGEKNKTKYESKTIGEVYNKNMNKQQTKDEFYWIDFVVFDKDKPILQVEVEETTSVIGGLERMSNTKENNQNIKSFVTSNNSGYKKRFLELINGTYKELNAKFIDPKKIEKLTKLLKI